MGRFQIFLAIITALVFTSAQAQQNLWEVTGIRQGDSLNVRTGPGAKFTDIGDLYEGDIVEVFGYDTTARWARIDHRGQTAFVARQYLMSTPCQCANVVPIGSDSGQTQADFTVTHSGILERRDGLRPDEFFNPITGESGLILADGSYQPYSFQPEFAVDPDMPVLPATFPNWTEGLTLDLNLLIRNILPFEHAETVINQAPTPYRENFAYKIRVLSILTSG